MLHPGRYARASALAALFLLPCVAAGQTIADCTPAKNRLAGGLRSGAQFATDVGLMQACPNGAATLASVWASAPVAVSDLQGLINASLNFHDSRLLSAEMAASQSSQPAVVRIAAISSAMSYVDSALAVYLPALMEPGSQPGFGAVSSVSEAGIIHGESAAPGNAKTTVLNRMEQMAGADASPDVRTAVGRLQRGVYTVIPITTTGFSLANVSCGQWRLRNPNPVMVFLRYELNQGAESGSVTVAGKAPDASHGETVFRTGIQCGAMVVKYGTQVVAAWIPIHPCTCNPEVVAP